MKFKKTILSAVILGIASLNAATPNEGNQNQKNINQDFGYAAADAYFAGAVLTQQEKESLVSKTKNDPSWLEANKYLYDEKYFYAGKPVQADPEDKYGKTILPKIPNYMKALDALNRSVTISKNPVSAYEGIFILKSYIGLEKPEQIAMFNNFTTVLYNAKHCEGYLAYGDLQKDKNLAKKIYEEGLMKCNKVRPYSFIFGSKIAKVNLDIKK